MSRRTTGRIVSLYMGCSIAGLAMGCMPFRNQNQAVANLGPPRVVTGSGVVTKRQLVAPAIGSVTDLRVDPATFEITAAGSSGAAVFTFAGKQRSAITFPMELERCTLVPLGKGGYEYLSRGSWVSPAMIVGANGKILGTAPAASGTDDAAAADLLGKGTPQVVVAYNGSGGLSLFGGSASPQWSVQDANVWHVEIGAVDSSGKLRIVHSNAAGQITVRDAAGTVLTRSPAPLYFSYFSLCRWPTRTSPQRLLANAGGSFLLFDTTGNVLKTFAAPSSTGMEYVAGTLVRLKGSQADYLAVVASPQMPMSNRSVLSIYDPHAKLVYEEVLPETCSAVAALPAPASKAETLLVGGFNHIWQFR